MKRRMITTILCTAAITLTGAALTTSGAEMNMPSFEGEQAGVPGNMDSQSFNNDGQAPPAMPDGQSFNTNGQMPPAMPEGQNVNAENQAPPAMPDGQSLNSDGQAPPAMPDGQSFNSDGQAPPAMPDGQDFNTNNGQMPPAMPEGQSFNSDSQTPPESGSPVIINGSAPGQIQPNADGQNAPAGAPMGGMPGVQNSSMGQPMQPMNDNGRVVARVTGIDGDTLTVETMKIGEDGTPSTESVVYDVSSLTLGEDIKTDSMVEIDLDSDGKVSSVNAGRNIPAGGVPQNGRMTQRGMMPPQGNLNGMAPQQVRFTEVTNDSDTETETDSAETETDSADAETDSADAETDTE